ncbi:AAA domain (dynein-related subfamily) [Micromonospora chersina]|uniref:AAA domain (Dynein-related subfamily) n=2 Tax=Micromonospora chersina TaxID=47854 RepID=A0A1C6V150_9ACTN|nr:AAA domain (dynein-related subfamily) [Micromonospora chersina]
MVVADRRAQGTTDHELSEILEAPGGLNNIRPRRNELVNIGLLEDSGRKRPTGSGKTATVWTLSGQMRRMLSIRFSTDDCELAGRVLQAADRRGLDAAQTAALAKARARLALLGRLAKRAAADEGVTVSAIVDDDKPILTVYISGMEPARSCVIARLDGQGLDLMFQLAPADEESLEAKESESRLRVRMQLASLSAQDRVPLESLASDDWIFEADNGTGARFATAGEWIAAMAAEPSSSGLVRRHIDPETLAATDNAGELVKQLTVVTLRAIATADDIGNDPTHVLVTELHWAEERARALVELAGRSRQLLFAGPPGTGKTLAARALARALGGDTRVKLVQFHPTYAYEDFVEGIRPRLDEAATELRYKVHKGVLRRLISAATDAPGAAHFLIVDEINRANLPRVLGELLFALEYRGEDNKIELPYSGEQIYMPENLWLIGTMNTADRSVALMDAAMRRRFKEVRFGVDLDALLRWHEKRTSVELGKEAVERLKRLNSQVVALLDDDRAIGHSFLMREDLAQVGFEAVWMEDLEAVLRDHLLGRQDDLPALRDAFLGPLL